MSEKMEDKKLGRNPFDHKKPARSGRHQPKEATVMYDLSAEPAVQQGSERSEIQNSTPLGILFPENPAWFFIDLWAGAATEPYFFWARSIGIVSGRLNPEARAYSHGLQIQIRGVVLDLGSSRKFAGIRRKMKIVLPAGDIAEDRRDQQRDR